jgi:hypothetical protein
MLTKDPTRRELRIGLLLMGVVVTADIFQVVDTLPIGPEGVRSEIGTWV